MCQTYNDQYGTNFISVMPTNLYGPNDNFDLKTSHVLSVLIRKFHEAKMNNQPAVEIWGTIFETIISEKIIDKQDLSNLGNVDYSNYLSDYLNESGIR